MRVHGNPQAGLPSRERRRRAENRDPAYPLHAPYLINLASANNRVRIRAQRSTTETCAAAADIGAAAVIVHGGHVADDAYIDKGFSAGARLGRLEPRFPSAWKHRRRRSRDGAPLTPSPTALGRHRRHRIGFCLDTCHLGGRRGLVMPSIGSSNYRPHRSGALQRLQGRSGIGP